MRRKRQKNNRKKRYISKISNGKTSCWGFTDSALVPQQGNRGWAGKPTLDRHPRRLLSEEKSTVISMERNNESQMARHNERLVQPGDERAWMDHVETRTLCGDPAAPVRGLWLHVTWLREDRASARAFHQHLAR